MSIFEVLFFLTLLVYTAPQIMVFCAVFVIIDPWWCPSLLLLMVVSENRTLSGPTVIIKTTRGAVITSDMGGDT